MAIPRRPGAGDPPVTGAAGGDPGQLWRPSIGTVARAVARHPSLWVGAGGALWRLAPAGWWRRRPFLPVPDDSYWRFRLETASGGDGGDARLSGDDVVAYLRWCRRMRAADR